MNDLVELRHLLHQNAELSMQETNTKKILMEYMQNNTDFSVHDCGRWFYAVKEGKKDDKIAFRADFDALPIDESIDLPYGSFTAGVAHKCGHDGHSSILCGLALELKGITPERTVYLIFQHAEEIGIGGRECRELLEKEKIREIYAFHNLPGYAEGSVVIRHGLSQPASKGLVIRLEGRQSHASDPEQGINPTKTAVRILEYADHLLKQPHDGMLLITVVNVRVGTRDFGVSAGDGEICLTLRAENEEDMLKTDRLLKKKAKELSESEGIRVSFEDVDVFPETRNNEKCLDKVIQCAEHNGLKVTEMAKLWRASEDFGWYLKKCDGAIFYVGAGEDWPPLHTSEYDFNDRIIPVAIRMFRSLIKAD